MPTVKFQTTLTAIGPDVILRVPKAASSKLPSRGLTVVDATLNGHSFKTVLEPDGKDSHWSRVSKAMLKAANAAAGTRVSITMTPAAEWPEPKVPPDLARALAADDDVRSVWTDITPLARWDWIRWIGSTRNPDARAIRIDKTLSKMRSGKRAACCFDRSQCTDPSVSHNGVLLDDAAKIPT
jgi:hypothetical protein